MPPIILPLESEKYLRDALEVQIDEVRKEKRKAAIRDYFAFASGLFVIFLSVLLAEQVLNWFKWADEVMKSMS